MCAIEHFFLFQIRPISSIAVFVTLSTLSSLLCDAAKTFMSSTYSKCVIFPSIGFDSFYPSVALRFHVIGVMHIVKSLGQSASPCGRPLLK